MADNDTFRYLGGLGLTNLFSVCANGCVRSVLSGTMTGGLEAILTHLPGTQNSCLVFSSSKTNLVKSLKNIVKYSVLGSGGSKMEPKWPLKVHLFLLLKS